MNRFASIFSRALGAVASLLIVASAMADVNSGPGFYIGAGVGGYHTAEDFKEIEYSYVKGDIKTSNLNTLMYGGMFGYKFTEYFRADVNGQYRKFNYSASDDLLKFNQKIKNYSVFLNGYVDIPNYTVFTPYVTAGAGCAHNVTSDLSATSSNRLNTELEFDSPGRNTTNLAFNAGVGTKMKMYKNFDLDIAYRYADLGKIKVDATNDGSDLPVPSASQHLKIHQLMLSVICNL